MCYFKLHRQDIIHEISLHACELSSQASIGEGTNSPTWNSNNKNEEHKLEFQLMKADTQNIQSKIKSMFLTEGMNNDYDNLLRNQMDALSYEVVKSA